MKKIRVSLKYVKFALTDLLKTFQVQFPVYWLEKKIALFEGKHLWPITLRTGRKFEMKSLQSLRSNTYYKENDLRVIALGMSQKKIDKLISTGTISKIRLYEPILILSAHVHRLKQNVE